MPPLQKNTEWDDEDWEEDDLTDYNNKVGKDSILICLDASASMQRSCTRDVDEDDEEEEQEQNDPSYFQGALKCVFELQKRKALKNPSDLVGILIYNTARLPEHEEEEPTGMFTLAKLATVSIDQVKELKELLDDAESDPSSLTEYLPPLDMAISTTALLERIVMEFKEAGIKDGSRRVFLITDDDDPGGRMDKSKDIHQVTISTKNKMRDLSELGASVVPFFLSQPDTVFDPSRFWDTVLSFQTIKAGGEAPDEPEPEVLRASDGLVALDMLLQEMQVKQMAKRALWTVPLMLTDDLVIGVKGYGMITEAKKPSPKYYFTDQPEAEMAEPSTNYFDARDEGAFPSAFDPDQLRLAFDFSGIGAAEPRAPRYENGNDDTGGQGPAPTQPEPMEVDDEATQDDLGNVIDHDGDDEDVKPVLPSSVKKEERIGPEGSKKPKITFTKLQLAKLRSVGLDPGIKIIGFQNSDSLKFEYNIKHSYFIYPDEATYTGSTRTFAALLRDLLDKDKIGIARCVYRKGSSPLMCAMIPQEETFTDAGAQDKPPGFHLIPFPFMDDMREPPTKVKGETVAVLKSGEEHVKLMCKIIKKMKGGNYLPENFPNPVLARHYAHLEALAFDGAWEQYEAEKVPDKTAPLWESMHERAGDRMLNWNESIAEDPMASTIVMKTKKATTSTDAKRKAEVDLDIDLEVVREKYKDGTLAKITVPVLKSFLRSVSRLPPGAPKKADLLDAAETYLRDDST